jgi:hypothetical protein
MYRQKVVLLLYLFTVIYGQIIPIQNATCPFGDLDDFYEIPKEESVENSVCFPLSSSVLSCCMESQLRRVENGSDMMSDILADFFYGCNGGMQD